MPTYTFRGVSHLHYDNIRVEADDEDEAREKALQALEDAEAPDNIELEVIQSTGEEEQSKIAQLEDEDTLPEIVEDDACFLFEYLKRGYTALPTIDENTTKVIYVRSETR